jgi:hypothetical protein
VGGLAALDSAAVGSEGAAPALMGGGGAAGAGSADVAGLESLDSQAVANEGASSNLMGNGGPAADSAPSTMNYQAQQQQQRRQQRPLDQLPVYRAPTYDELAARFTVPSSRELKTGPGFVSMRALAQAGASGQDQISQNGVHIGAIRALHTDISRLEELARRKGVKV